jgi:uncharacterized protein YbbK (DUF523 family)
VPMHLPTREELLSLPEPTPSHPLRILLSGCLAGRPCGVDGTSYGEWSLLQKLAQAPNARLIPFCPEDFSFGTPRALCNIHGGDGFDVLDGRARVLTEAGADWTGPMVKAAHRMLELAREHQAHLAILMDMSAACGSQVISDGHRTVTDRKYRQGTGVCAALLLRQGFRVMSQRDFKSLGYLLQRLDPGHVPDSQAVDHHETPWYREYFGGAK